MDGAGRCWQYLLRCLCMAGCCLFGLLTVPASAEERLPLFDAHLHYNWEPAPFLPLGRVLELLRAEGIVGILANSRPNDGTRALVDAQPKDIRVVPFIRPYMVRSDIGSWFDDPAIFELVEREFARGGYAGIGEFHLYGRQADTAWVRRSVDFSVPQPVSARSRR